MGLARITLTVEIPSGADEVTDELINQVADFVEASSFDVYQLSVERYAPQPGPGWRLVDGEWFYSDEWLNDESTIVDSGDPDA